MTYIIAEWGGHGATQSEVDAVSGRAARAGQSTGHIALMRAKIMID